MVVERASGVGTPPISFVTEASRPDGVPRLEALEQLVPSPLPPATTGDPAASCAGDTIVIVETRVGASRTYGPCTLPAWAAELIRAATPPAA